MRRPIWTVFSSRVVSMTDVLRLRVECGGRLPVRFLRNTRARVMLRHRHLVDLAEQNGEARACRASMAARCLPHAAVDLVREAVHAADTSPRHLAPQREATRFSEDLRSFESFRLTLVGVFILRFAGVSMVRSASSDRLTGGERGPMSREMVEGEGKARNVPLVHRRWIL